MKDEYEIVYLPICIGAGIALGSVLGHKIKDIGIGTSIGIIAGCGIGGILDYIKSKKS